METNLVSSPSDPKVQGNREPQDVINNYRKISTRMPQDSTPQVHITSVSSRGKNCNMVQPCNSLPVKKTSLATHITCLPYPQKISSQVTMMEKGMRQNSNCKRGCKIQRAFWTEIMGDIMYFHQALKHPDASNFVQAVVKEVNEYVDNKHWELIKHSHIPNNVEIVLSVWAVHCKCNLTTNEMIKHKAGLNINGGKQTYGINYFKTYASIVTWSTISLLIIFAIFFNWALKQADFVMAYT